MKMFCFVGGGGDGHTFLHVTASDMVLGVLSVGKIKEQLRPVKSEVFLGSFASCS